MLRRSAISILSLFLLTFANAVSAADPIWIDVRTADEYASNHVSVAHNIPYTEIARRIDEVADSRDAEIYLYCRSGRRSGIARTTLNTLGFTNVINLGGIDAARKTAVSMNICPEADASDC